MVENNNKPLALNTHWVCVRLTSTRPRNTKIYHYKATPTITFQLNHERCRCNFLSVLKMMTDTIKSPNILTTRSAAKITTLDNYLRLVHLRFD